MSCTGVKCCFCKLGISVAVWVHKHKPKEKPKWLFSVGPMYRWGPKLVFTGLHFVPVVPACPYGNRNKRVYLRARKYFHLTKWKYYLRIKDLVFGRARWRGFPLGEMDEQNKTQRACMGTCANTAAVLWWSLCLSWNYISCRFASLVWQAVKWMTALPHKLNNLRVKL